MEIQREEHGNKGAFFIEENGERLAEMTYVKAGEGKIIIDHTGVGEKLKGKGIGKRLVEAGVGYARENNLKIIPLCPFAKSVFEKTLEFQDVLAA
jgi:Predicted acetyltransferase